MRLALIFVMSLAACDCGDRTRQLLSDIQADPKILDFGTTATPLMKTVQLRNDGRAAFP